MVAHALQVLGHEQQVGARGDVARVFHHVRQQLAEQRGVLRVQTGVIIAQLQRRGGVVVAVGLDRAAHLLCGQPAQGAQALDLRQRRHLAQGDRALGHVGRVIADAFDIGRDAQAGQDLAQVACHRPAQRQAHHVVADVLLKLIDGFIVGDDALGSVLVALLDDVHGRLQLRDRHLAHAHDLGHQALLFFVVALDDVVVGKIHGLQSG